MSAVIYVEGGGEGRKLRGECRKGFIAFLEKAGLRGRMPEIKASGSRQNAYAQFRARHNKNDVTALLLVDSEGPVTAPGNGRSTVAAAPGPRRLGASRPGPPTSNAI